MIGDKDEKNFPESTEEEENPFEQEEVFPLGEEQVSGEEAAPSGDGAAYMPEDAVIEYGYDSGEDFYDPQKSKEAEEDSVFMTGESSPAEPASPPPPPPPSMDSDLTSAIESDPVAQYDETQNQGGYSNQLDSMFPDDGFDSGGSLDWDNNSKTEAAAPPPPPPPPAPADDSSATEPFASGTYDEEGVPDSPSGYMVVTPSGRKKGLSPEIAQLLDRTSKRQAAVQAIEAEGVGTKKSGIVVAILIILILVVAGIAGYFFSKLQESGKEIEQVKQNALKSQNAIRTEYEQKIGLVQDKKEELRQALETKNKAHEDYILSVEDKVSKYNMLEQARLDLEEKVAQLQEENKRIDALKKEIESRDAKISSLNSDIHTLKKQENELELGIISRDTRIADLESQISSNEERITALKDELDKISNTSMKVSASELAKLRDTVMKQENKIESLEKRNSELETQIEWMSKPTGKDDPIDQLNRLRMELLVKGKELIRLEEELKNNEDELLRYSSPEYAIIKWSDALNSGDLSRLIEFYSESNINYKRYTSGGDKRRELAEEFKNLCSYRVEPEVISIELFPRESKARAHLILHMSRDGEVKKVKANMVLVRQFDEWVILDEGF